jgi:2-iminobutanoate/2-iminopropanoate deaminase
MNTLINPTNVGAPAASYSLAVKSSANSTWLHTAGIVGSRPDGSLAESVGEQAEEIWRSLSVIFEEAGFAMTDLVSYTTFAVQGQDLLPVMAARDSALDGHRAASTLIVVPTLARPEWLVEIVAIAAR